QRLEGGDQGVPAERGRVPGNAGGGEEAGRPLVAEDAQVLQVPPEHAGVQQLVVRLVARARVVPGPVGALQRGQGGVEVEVRVGVRVADGGQDVDEQDERLLGLEA